MGGAHAALADPEIAAFATLLFSATRHVLLVLPTELSVYCHRHFSALKHAWAADPGIAAKENKEIKMTTSEATENQASLPTRSVRDVVVRFAGDSGDGMQLTGGEFTRATALTGNDIATFPDFPAEIRAPAGTLAGVSGFQLHFASRSIFTPGDAPDVLVAMNPAALKVNLDDLREGGMLVVNKGAFSEGNLKKAGFESNPLEDGSLDGIRLISIDMSDMVQKALEGLDLSIKEVLRTKNFFALGLMYWLYNKPIQKQLEWIEGKFKKKNPVYAEANIRAFKAGYHYGETAELFSETYSVDKAPMDPGVYRRIMGNSALVQGLVVAAKKAELPLFLGSYPITPASDILHEMSRYRNQGAVTFQAEDEIAAMGAVVGAAYGGALSICSTSGPGFALKAEAMGLGVILELPMIVVNVQRAGPSTGLPTKTEQADLLQVMYGRNGESPMAVVAAQSPADCFDAAVEAAHIATKYMVPVCLMTDGYIANGAEPWKIPDVEKLPDMKVSFRTDPEGYQVYARDEATLARAWVKPGTPGLEHRVGGLEKDYLTGEVSYDPINHERMCQVRADKLQRAVVDVPEAEVFGEDEGDLLVIGWGGTYGALRQAVGMKQGEGKKVSHMHLRWINPFPKNLEATLGRFKKILVCELNMGQLWRILRADFLVDAEKYNKVQGKPFSVAEIGRAIDESLGGLQ
jgi:2-oxoglutarate ferredoxin oxidoreductase subunit alpha